MGLTSLILATAFSTTINAQPVQPYTPPPKPAVIIQKNAYLRDEQELGYEWFGLREMGDINHLPWLPRTAGNGRRRAYGNRRMDSLGKEYESRLPDVKN